MTDEKQIAQEAQVTTSDEASAQEATIPEWVKDPNKAYSEIRNAREEAKSHRVKALELEQRLKAIEDAEKAKAEQETRKKGDFETLLSQREKELNELRQQYENERMNALRMRIGAEAGLPSALMERLRGSNEAELKADAEALKALIPTQKQDAKAGSSTVTSPAQGAKTGETYEQKVKRIYGSRRGSGGSGTFG